MKKFSITGHILPIK